MGSKFFPEKNDWQYFWGEYLFTVIQGDYLENLNTAGCPRRVDRSRLAIFSKYCEKSIAALDILKWLKSVEVWLILLTN